MWRLQAGERLVGDFLEAAPDAMVVVGADGRIQLVNAQLEALFGRHRAELLDKPVEVLLPARLRDAHRAHRERYLGDARPRVMGAGLELWGLRGDGCEFPVDVSLSPVRTASGVIVVAAIRDITERWRSERALASKMHELAGIASTDPLTGLPNRREFERLLTLPHATGYAVLAIDVDGLKAVNDAHGHEAGDVHLRTIAAALSLAVRDADFVARTGGDEFAALLPGRTLEEATRVAERLRRAMYGVVVPHGFARVSIGCAAGPADADGLTVWAAADDALYRAKAGGRDRVWGAPPAPPEGSRRVAWERALPALIAQGGMGVVYQPVVRLDDRAVVGYEALCRPHGAPSTDVRELFSAAERIGLHRDLDWLCRRVAIGEARRLPPQRLLFVHVGLPALLDPVHDVDQMLLLLRWGGLEPALVVLEISAREAVRDCMLLREVLTEYRRAGFRFSLDDVGEGRATFEVLATAVPEFVEVSAATAARSAAESGARGLLRGLTAFVAETGGEVVAAGLESQDDVRRMLDLGVHLGQGLALGAPPVLLQGRIRHPQRR